MCKGELKTKFKEGDPMSLRDRIEALDNGWNKEADDILEDIGLEYSIDSITKYNTGFNKVYNYARDGEWSPEFYFTDQCSKLEAFKKVLLWLLDKSGLESHKKGDKITIESKGKTYKVKILEEV